MKRTWQLGLAIAALAVVLGAVAGWLSAPRYRPPADSGEQRLRMRAEQFYRAAQVADFEAKARFFTPARQLDERKELLEVAERSLQAWRNFKPETRATFEQGAETIQAGELAVELEGDWAVTSGKLISYQGELEIPIPLDEVVWVRTGGDWWVYSLTYAELNAYGNPPDFARHVLKLQSQAGQLAADLELPEELRDEDATPGNEPAAEPAEDAARDTEEAPSDE